MAAPEAPLTSLLPPGLDADRLPQHVGIIMDGNGRWAKQRGNLRSFGHRSAVQAVRDTIEAAAEWGVPYVTLFAFSTENWKRPRLEVEALMQLLVSTIRRETATLLENDIRLHAIGQLDRLPKTAQRELAEARRLTAGNKRMTLTLALSYGARQDILHATRQLAQQVANGTLDPQAITETHLKQALSTADLPDPELIIRTSGELRISNFLLWEIAYAELYVTPKLWPDFRKADLLDALMHFQSRERRFGLTGDQVAGA